MKKPTVYLETSIISALWYDGADVALLFRRLRTREWWDGERRQFELRASLFVESELRSGHFPGQSECGRTVRRLRYLPVTANIREYADEFVRRNLVPASKPTDAAHLAVAVTNELDYLLTWNYAHLANPVIQQKLREFCAETRLRVPLLVSPETIPQSRLGQSIRRRR